MPQFSYLFFFGLGIKIGCGQRRSCQWVTSARCEGDYNICSAFPTLQEALSFFHFSPVFLFFLCSKQPQQLDEAIKIPKETIEILKNQVFGFDTFFVTSQDPYEVCACLSFFFAYVQRSLFKKIGSCFSARPECCSKETCAGNLVKVMKRYQRDCKYVMFSILLLI